MIAVKYDRPGEPSKVLNVTEIETPAPKAGEVLVKLSHMPITPADLAIIRGVYRTGQSPDAIPGSEGLGTVVAVGDGVHGTSVNSPVLVLPMRVRPGWTNGTWQEFISLPESQVFPVPADLNSPGISHFFISILTPWLMIEDLKLSKGQWLLITGAGSTVGRVMIQIAKLLEISVIGVVRRPEQCAEVLQLGATEAICSTTEDISKRAMEITSMKGVNGVIEAVGGKVATQCFRALGDDGKMVIYGLLERERESSFDIRRMLFYCQEIKGFWLPRWWELADVKTRAAAVNKVLDLMRKGNLSAGVEAEYGLRDVRAAVEHAERPGNKGRVLLTP